MNNMIAWDTIAWIAAEAEPPRADSEDGQREERSEARGAAFPAFAKNAKDGTPTRVPAQELVAHSFPARVRAHPAETPEGTGTAFPPFTENAQGGASTEFLTSPPGAMVEGRSDEPERRVYRGRTVAMLRRYMRYSIETGRLPSLVGREFFRSKVTSYRVTTFEDRVIFVHDMEKCLQRLDEISRQVLGRVVLQEYEHDQAARLLGCTRMTVHRKLLEALDKLSDILIEVELLDALPSTMKKSCQEGGDIDFPISDCEQGK